MSSKTDRSTWGKIGSIRWSFTLRRTLSKDCPQDLLSEDSDTDLNFVVEHAAQAEVGFATVFFCPLLFPERCLLRLDYDDLNLLD